MDLFSLGYTRVVYIRLKLFARGCTFLIVWLVRHQLGIANLRLVSEREPGLPLQRMVGRQWTVLHWPRTGSVSETFWATVRELGHAFLQQWP